MTDATRVMTWNIKGGRDWLGRDRLDRVIDLVKAVDPDIVALQEIDSRGSHLHPVERLEEALGHRGIRAAAIIAEDGDYGQVLLSRWPMTAAEVHDISIPRCEPRRAIGSIIRTPAGPLWVVATHLGLKFVERRFQAGQLAAIAVKPTLPSIVLGDFNDWMWPGSIRGELAKVLRSRTHHRTFPARFPLLKLDRIYASQSVQLLATRVIRSAHVCSDHLPVVAEVRIAADRRGAGDHCACSAGAEAPPRRKAFAGSP